MITEKDIQTAIIKALRPYAKVYNITTGVFKVKNPGGSYRWISTFPKGTPDLMGFRYEDGRAFFIEVKKPGGRLSKEQIDFAEWVKTSEALYGVAKTAQEALHIIGVETLF